MLDRVSGAHGVCGLEGEIDTRHVMQQVLHELIAVVVHSMKELLGIGVGGCDGKSVKDCISSLLMMLHLLLRTLHIRESGCL